MMKESMVRNARQLMHEGGMSSLFTMISGERDLNHAEHRTRLLPSYDAVKTTQGEE